MAFQGDLSNINLAGVFQNLLHNTQTGTLRVQVGPDGPPAAGTQAAGGHIYFDEGKIRMYSAGEGAGVPLGELLVGRGKLTPEDLAAAEKKRRKGDSLSAVLEKTHRAEPALIAETVRSYVLEGIYDLFTWKGGSFHFEEGAAPDGLFDPEVIEAELTIEVNEVILEAARRMDEWDRIHKLVAGPREVFVLRRERVEDVEALEGGDLQRVARLLDGRRDVAALVSDAGIGRFRTYKILAEMLREQQARPVSTADLIEAAAEAESDADPAVAIRLYRRILQTEPNHLEARGHLAALLEAQGDLQAAATEHKLRANALLDRGERPEAARAFEQAVGLMPKDVDCRERWLALLVEMDDHAAAARVGAELAQTYRDLGLAEKARETYQRLLSLPLERPGPLRLALAATCVRLGAVREAMQILKALAAEAVAEGRDAEALEALREAVEIDPDDFETRRRLQDIESGRLTRRRERRRRLKRLAVSLVMAAPLVAWLISDGVARVEFQRLNRQVHRQGALGKPTAGRLASIPGKFRALSRRYWWTWTAHEARRLDRTYQAIVSRIRLLAARHALNGDRLDEALRLYNQIRTGAMKPDPETQQEAEQAVRRLRRGGRPSAPAPDTSP